MKILRTAALICTALLLLSCEELFFKPVPGTSPAEIFEQVWSFADEEYSFFEYKNIDWAAKKTEYAPQIKENMTEEELFSVLADLLYELKDGHVNLTSPFDRSRNWTWFLNHESNYDYELLEREYFKEDQQYVGSSFILYDFGDAGYIHYRSFSNPVTERDLDYVIEKFSAEPYKGLIIDIRGNGGGSLSNVYTIANRLTDKEHFFAQEQVKTGPGHEDFCPLYDLKLTPPEEGKIYTKPVVVLTNRMCYSAANYFATAVKNLEHVTLLGDTTGGGGGIPANTMLTNGWALRVSSSRLFITDPDSTMTMTERNVEHGVAPHVKLDIDPADTSAGKDTLIEAALARLRN